MLMFDIISRRYQLPPAEETPAVMVEADIPPATPKRISQPELPLDITPPAELLLQKKARKVQFSFNS